MILEIKPAIIHQNQWPSKTFKHFIVSLIPIKTLKDDIYVNECENFIRKLGKFIQFNQLPTRHRFRHFLEDAFVDTNASSRKYQQMRPPENNNKMRPPVKCRKRYLVGNWLNWMNFPNFRMKFSCSFTEISSLYITLGVKFCISTLFHVSSRDKRLIAYYTC